MRLENHRFRHEEKDGEARNGTYLQIAIPYGISVALSQNGYGIQLRKGSVKK